MEKETMLAARSCKKGEGRANGSVDSSDMKLNFVRGTASWYEINTWGFAQQSKVNLFKNLPKIMSS